MNQTAFVRACSIASLLLLVGCADASDIAWLERIEIDSGQAFQGPWRMNESQFLYVDDPSVAFGPDGETGVVWVDNAQRDVLFQMLEADGSKRFAEPVNVSRTPNVFSWLPRFVFGEEDDVFVLWQEIVFAGGSHGGEIFFARSEDGGASFSQPINLSNTTGGAGKGRLTQQIWSNGSLDLARRAEGRLYAAWTEFYGALHLAWSDDGGTSFAEPVHVAGHFEVPTRGPALALGPDSEVWLAWTVGEDAAADIHVARSRDGGQSFDAPMIVDSGQAHADAPALAVGSDGILHLAFGENPPGFRGLPRIRYTRLSVGGDGFEPLRTLSNEDFGANYPALVAAADRSILVSWRQFPSPRSRPLGMGFALSTDGGERFSVPEVIPGSDDPALGFNGSLQGLLMAPLAMDDSGRVAVVNSTFLPGERSAIWLQKGRFKNQPE